MIISFALQMQYLPSTPFPTSCNCSAESPSNGETFQQLLLGRSPILMLLAYKIQTDSLEYLKMEKLGQWYIYSVNPHRISPYCLFLFNHTSYLNYRNGLHNIYLCKLVLRTLRYWLVKCWFISPVGSVPGVMPPTPVQVYCVTDGFTSSVSVEHWGLWKDSVLQWLRWHGQLKLLVDRVTHSTSLWGVVYFSFPVENVFLFGSGKDACPGFWIAALAAFQALAYSC